MTSSSPSSLQTVIRTMRPPFLLLVLSCLSIAVAGTYLLELAWSWVDMGLIIAASLSSHMAVNMLNEYEDFSSELDLNTQRTPFSGGSGGLPDAPHNVNAVKWGAFTTLAITITCGLALVFRHEGTAQLLLVVLGVVGTVIIYTYTRYINRSPWLCLIAPGLAFGPIMVVGSFVALTGQYAWQVSVLSLIPFFLVNNLLLLNQFPDIEADKAHGRYHLLIKCGTRFCARILMLQWVLTAAVVVFTVMSDVVPAFSALALLVIVVTLPIFKRAVEFNGIDDSFLQVMGKNVGVTLLTPVILSLGIVLGS